MMSSIVVPETSEDLNTLPNFPLFSRLVGYAHRLAPTHDAIRDIVSGTTANHTRLLNDVLSLRNNVHQILDEGTRQSLSRGEEVFLMLLAPPGYQYAVGLLAILALGAVIVPVSPHVPLREALYFADKIASRGILFHPRCSELVTAMREHICARSNATFTSIDMTPSLSTKNLCADEIYISSRKSLNPMQAGLAIFTSGTTGPPKAVILPREILSSSTQNLADHYSLSPADTALHCMPVHHIAGIAVCFIPFLLAGCTIEFEPFNVERVWERWRKGGLTIFGGVPTMFMRLMRHYEDNLRNSPNHEEYVKGARSHRFMMSGTSSLPRPLRLKWQTLTGGKRILERYGTSEFNSGILTPLNNSHDVPDGSVGVVLPGCHIKLSNGDEGELLVKTPGIFLRYHGDIAATAAAFDDDGYYKSGDIGRREGPYFFISGRASVDIIKSGGYKISALDIEREMLTLDYIAEASVIGVADEEFGQRVAAVLVLRDTTQKLSLSKLRNDLRSMMSSYKLPTMLYLAEDLVKTASGKVQKKALGKEVFESGKYVQDIQIFAPTRNSIRSRL